MLKPIFVIIGIVSLILIGIAAFSSNRTEVVNVPEIPVRAVSGNSEDKDISAIRTFMGDENYKVTYVGADFASNFKVVKTGTSETPDEWKKTVNKYRSEQTVGKNCGVYEFEVFQKTNEVVLAVITASGKTNCEVAGSLGADGINTPTLPESDIKIIGNGFLSRIPTKYYPSIKSDFVVKTAGQDGGELPTYQWSWEDAGYPSQQGITMDPKYPMIRFNISSGGVLTYYQNTIPLVTDNGVLPYNTTLTGTFATCLPKNDNFSTEECMIGIKTDDNAYYALDFSLMSQTAPSLRNGERFSAQGVLTPIEMVSSNSGFRSIGLGVFSVTSSVKKL